eukprot:TRINITY_DN2891_c1_g1_i1.p1 TRINITY_DN2891_c1_g1~~TRINITY_DN2891_c1_g1_i1.p1  ORF type:complete len:210 (+),score=65.42 TRINITY_DN2891_c1_g1_i1:73-702(+)
MNRGEVLHTVPDTEDDFSAEGFEEPLNASFSCADERPKHPYVCTVRRKIKPVQCESSKNSADSNTTADLSKTTLLKFSPCDKVVYADILKKAKGGATQRGLGRRLKVVRGRKESMNTLKEYWTKKAEIEEKYAKLVQKIDKESLIEMSYRISSAHNPLAAAETIDQLKDIEEYYKDGKELINRQRVIELEELLNSFKMKLNKPLSRVHM